MGKVISTLITVVVAVSASAVLWIGANLLFNQARDHWTRFSALAWGAVGFFIGVLLSGNRLTLASEGGLVNWIWLPLVLAVVTAGIGWALSTIDDASQRLILALSASALIGVGIGLLIRPEVQPGVDPGAVAIWLAIGLAIGAGIQTLRRAPIETGLLYGAAIGWLLGYWGGADLGAGSMVTAVVGAVVPAVLVGVRIGRSPNLSTVQRTVLEQKSRSWIFLGPAMLFIVGALVVPAIRTVYLSLLDRSSQSWVGLDNYQAIFANTNSWNIANWSNMFGSMLFYIGAILVVLALIVGLQQRRQTGRMVELGGPSAGPLIVGGLLVTFAAFTALRGTIINNLWWVVTVTFASTAIGLAVAVLADGARLERVAKSIIFMPMAISLVGASVIWRFMYVTRDSSLEQTGVMNAVWVGLGRLSTGSGIPTILMGVLIAAVLAGIGTLLARNLVRREWAKLILPGLAFFLVGWFLWRYLGAGVGGQRPNPVTGEIQANPIAFVQEGPFNNFWLMVILIWIQTGFAMVILSAAIRAVPEEFIEAARVDGATQSQIFWRIVLPQISTTIGVVVTTLIVLVMKVYDIVKVVTNGNFGTQVLANDMFNTAFISRETGRGAALAVLILVSVLPVMYLNIRRMQEDR
jgi:ABC-type sugar transport system permease subunit